MNIDFSKIEQYASIMETYMHMMGGINEDYDERLHLKIYKLSLELTKLQHSMAYTLATVYHLMSKQRCKFGKILPQLVKMINVDGWITLKTCRLVIGKYHPECLQDFDKLAILL